MNELWVALISGGMALLGVGISSLISYGTSKQDKKWQRANELRQKKEELYVRVIKEFDIPATINQFVSSPISFDITGDESFDVAAQMQLYATKDVNRAYNQALEAYEGDLPIGAKESRYTDLIEAMREDLGIKS